MSKAKKSNHSTKNSKTSKISKTDTVRQLLAKGKTPEEVSKAMTSLYIKEGKDTTWSEKRGKGIVSLFLKEYGHPKAA